MAIQLALSVVQPQSTGLGGGAFVVIFNATTGQYYTLDAREEAPARFHSHIFCNATDCMSNTSCDCTRGAWDMTERETGGNPVGVPGVLAACDRLLREFGTRSFASLVAPAVRLAREGFAMYPHLRNRILRNRARLARFNVRAGAVSMRWGRLLSHYAPRAGLGRAVSRRRRRAAAAWRGVPQPRPR